MDFQSNWEAQHVILSVHWKRQLCWGKKSRKKETHQQRWRETDAHLCWRIKSSDYYDLFAFGKGILNIWMTVTKYRLRVITQQTNTSVLKTCMNMNIGNGSNILTQPMWHVIIPMRQYICKKKKKKSFRWGFIPKWIRHVNGMSTTRDLLNDMYHILRLRCGSFQNEPDMFTKLIREVAWAMKRGMEANNLYRHYVEIGMLSHLLYSSLGLQLGYKVICILFRSLSNIISLIWQTTAVLYLLRIVLKLQHMQQKQTFMAGQDYMGTSSE